MNCVSGVASKNLVIKQNERVFSIEYIMPGLFYACFYDDKRYFGDIITKVDPPSSGSSCRFYCFGCDKMKCVENLM